MPFKFSKKSRSTPAAEAISSTQTNPDNLLKHEILKVVFSNFAEEGSSLSAMRGAVKVMPLLISAMGKDQIALEDMMLTWHTSSVLSVSTSPDLLVNNGDTDWLIQVTDDWAKQLKYLKEVCLTPLSEFSQNQCTFNSSAGKAAEIAKIFKLVDALQRHRAQLFVGQTPISFPTIDFQTTRELDDVRNIIGRLEHINFRSKTGGMEIRQGARKTRTVNFSCPCPQVFSRLRKIEGYMYLSYKPTIDLLSTHDGQLHSMSIISVENEVSDTDQDGFDFESS